MHRLISGTILCLLVLTAPFATSNGGWLPWSDNTLVTMDDRKYSAEDYRSWWQNWQEPEMSFPETPESFIDWMLLVREAEKMKLYEDPGYRKKVLTFLKARTLMLLKAEEVDSRISIRENDVWDRYEKMYAPRYQLNVLFFQSRADADKLLEKTSGGLIGDERIGELVSGEGGPARMETGWYRKVSVDPGWHDIITALDKGELSEPVDWKTGVVVLRLQERKQGDKDDFETVRREIHEKLWKEMSNIRTVELLKSLREKYHVQVDHERLERLDINAADDGFSEQPIVTTDHGTISEKEFMIQVRRLQKFRRQNGFSEDEDSLYKEQVLNGIIDQTLTSWEGLARGYEKKPPFEQTYLFYCQNRMIKVLEEKLFSPQAQVSTGEVRDYYEEHIQEYSRPEIARLVSVEGDPEMINSLWTAVATGGDFRSSALERYDLNLPVRDIPVDHLSPDLLAVVQKLTKGELSPVFTVNGRKSVVQLIERIPAQPLPLAMVGKEIGKQLHTERMQQVRQEYLNKLRSGSSITVNSEVWQQLTKEMEQKDAEKTEQ